MKPQELYEIWAPRDGLWSPWVKPVLFFQMPKLEAPTALPSPAEGSHWIVQNDGRTAVVIDMPGREAVLYGLICARLGFRPVPLYNACSAHGELVSMTELSNTLFRATQNITGLSLSRQAPPVFLLDSRRLDGMPIPERFDNRWMVFPQDFPSATKLKSAGISKILLVQKTQTQPIHDLAHVLVTWQQQGLKIMFDNPENPEGPTPMTVHRPSIVPYLFYRVLALFGFRKNSAGGFGSVIPVPGESSGYG